MKVALKTNRIKNEYRRYKSNWYWNRKTTKIKTYLNRKQRIKIKIEKRDQKRKKIKLKLQENYNHEKAIEIIQKNS